MTISKKLLMISALALGMQPITQAYFVTDYKTETTDIVKFAHMLEQSTNADAQETLADISHIKKILRWQPKISLEEGIKQLIA